MNNAWHVGIAGSHRDDHLYPEKEALVVPLIVLLLIVAVLGGAGIAAHLLWFVLLIAVALWLVGFFVGGLERAVGGGRRRWYGRW
jgi:hypothetical protein